MIQQPAVPASTVAVTSQSGQVAYVTVTGGTVTEIAVNGASVATASNFTATVPAGQAIAVTYSVAPAWYWSPMTPAVPASGVAVVNPTGQDITVIIAAGTVTAVTVNGTSVATASPAQIMLPAGASVTLTYSAAPVWAWLNYPAIAGADSTGNAYMQENTVPPSGVAGYSPLSAMPWPVHATAGEAGLAAGVAN